jgi:hypothetical protein
MNRADMMGTSLEHELRRTSEGGYYKGYRSNVSAESRAMIEQNIDAALGGSNVSNYATDNSSQGVGVSGRDPLYRSVFESGGETFSVPRNPHARGYGRYDDWRKSVEGSGTPHGVTRLGAGTPERGEPTFANIGGGSDLDYIAAHGGHSSTLQNGKIVPGHPGASIPIDPELAARMRTAGEAYTKETGKQPQFGEMDRGSDVQAVYYNRYKHGGNIAAPPGGSRHQSGKAVDTPRGDFLDWLHKGNASKYGLHFPVYERTGKDYGHMEASSSFKRPTASSISSRHVFSLSR